MLSHNVENRNCWSVIQIPMKHLKSEEFTVSLDFETSGACEFRYIIDETTWENEWGANRHVPSSFAGVENSVAEV